MRGEKAAVGVQSQITQRGKAHVETKLRMEQAIHLLQFRRDFPLRHAIIMKRKAIEHHGVQMHIHQAGHQCQACTIDHLSLGGNFYFALGAHRFDAAAFEHDHRVF